MAESWSNIRVVVNVDGTEQEPDYSNKQVTAYEYDAHGRTVKTTRSGYVAGALEISLSTQTRYDAHGRVVAESDPYDEIVLDVTWDETDQTYKAGTVDIPTKLSEYDDYGRLTAVILAAVVHPDTAQLVRPRYEYTYDENGNLMTIRDNVVHVSAGVGNYDHDGQTGDDTRVTALTYDARGRQTSRSICPFSRKDGRIAGELTEDRSQIGLESPGHHGGTADCAAVAV